LTYLLDTNVCVAFLRRGTQANVARKLAALSSTEISVCAVVKQELIYGALHSERSAENLAKVRRLVDAFFSYPFDDAAAAVAGQLKHELATQGSPIGPYDLQIAAIALAQNLTLVTHNCAEFLRVPGLRVEDWET